MAVEEINAAGGILGKKIELEFVRHADAIRARPRAAMQRALDDEAYRALRPGLFRLGQRHAEADAPTPRCRSSPAARPRRSPRRATQFIFRTSFGQNVVDAEDRQLHARRVKAKKVAVVWVNNDFGKGGRDAFIKELEARGIKVAADISTENGQADFAADVVKAKGANADALFVYLNEEESARFLREAKKQGVDKPLIGETTLIGQKVIELAGDAANGVKGHVGLTADAPIPAIQEFGKKYEEKFKSKPDHNGIKGYIGAYVVKAATEKIGKFDRKALAEALRGLKITPTRTPGILIDATWDDNGELDRDQLPGRGRGRQAGDHGDAAEARRSSRIRARAGRAALAGRRGRSRLRARRSWRGAMTDFLQLIVPGSRPARSMRWPRSASRCCGRRRRPSTSRRASSSCCRRSSC